MENQNDSIIQPSTSPATSSFNQLPIFIQKVTETSIQSKNLKLNEIETTKTTQVPIETYINIQKILISKPSTQTPVQTFLTPTVTQIPIENSTNIPITINEVTDMETDDILQVITKPSTPSFVQPKFAQISESAIHSDDQMDIDEMDHNESATEMEADEAIETYENSTETSFTNMNHTATLEAKYIFISNIHHL